MASIKLKLKEAVENYQNQFPTEQRPNHLKMAVEIGISPNTMSRYVNNKVERPELSVVARFCDYLGITDIRDVFELVDDEEEPTE
ncbi:MAG: helix-turn-helix transcriptional regulator [Chloroflexota bacterium]